MIISFDTFSQCITPIIGGGGTSGNARCPSTRYRNARSVYLITADEIAAAGFAPGSTIDGISWNYLTAPTISGTGNLKIYLQNTADIAYSKGTDFPTAIGPMQLVHNNPTLLPAATGFFNINFVGGTPFTYTGGGVYVAFDWDYCVGTLDVSCVVGCNTALANGLAGLQNTGACLTLTALTASSFRPDTRFIATAINDAKVDYIYTVGETPLNYTNNHVVSAIITNRSNTAFTNFNVTLNVSGANTFTNVQTIANLPGCASQTVTFAPYTYSNAGNNIVQVSVPPDNNNLNNTKQVNQTITLDRYNYRYGSEVKSGGVGVNGNTAALTAKFNTNASLTLTHVNVEFGVAGLPYRFAIYGDNGGMPSTTPIYVDANDRLSLLNTPMDIALETPVTVPSGNFYVAIHQQSATNMSLAYATETPLRLSTFHFATPLPPASWMDLAPNNSFRPLLGVKFCYPYTPSVIAGNNTVCEGSTNTYSVTPIPEATSYTWTLPGGWTGVSNTNTITATAGANGGNITCVANYICGSSTASSLAVTVNPKPTVTASANPAAICSGSSSTLSASGATSYIWNPGALPGNSINVSPTITSTYTVTGTDINGCTNTTIINVHVDHTLTGTGSASPDTICLGASSTINGTATNLCFGNINDFNGDYAPVNWTMTQNNSNGTVNTANTPAYIVMTSSNNLSATPGFTTYSIPMSCSGNVTFNWNYSHSDPTGSIFDIPQYTINGGSPIEFPNFIIGGSNSQTGSASIPVNAGDVFAFRMYTIDNDAISGNVTISNFTAPAPAATGTVSVWDQPSGGTNLGAPPQVVTPITAGTINYYLEVTSGVCVNPSRVAIPILVNAASTVTASISPATTCNQTSAT
ncbi:MAG: hypothetical protein LC096_00400, partial [Bacteroidia bacterium]|nr:hypothetical protein [Bacteroidia bacterium]